MYKCKICQSDLQFFGKDDLYCPWCGASFSTYEFEDTEEEDTEYKMEDSWL